MMLAFVLGAALAEEETQLEESEEGKQLIPAGLAILTPFLGLLGPLTTLINVGSQIVILIALIGFVTGLKGVVDFDKIFKKEEDVYVDTGYAPIADTGYLRRGDYGPSVGYTGNQDYAPNAYNRLTAQVNQAVDAQF